MGRTLRWTSPGVGLPGLQCEPGELLLSWTSESSSQSQEACPTHALLLRTLMVGQSVDRVLHMPTWALGVLLAPFPHLHHPVLPSEQGN